MWKHAGTLHLVGTDEETIYNTFSLLLENTKEYAKMSHSVNPYSERNKFTYEKTDLRFPRSATREAWGTCTGMERR